MCTGPPDPLALRPFVRHAARRAGWTARGVLDVDDLEQHGMEAVCRAAKTWRPERGPFRMWAQNKAVYSMIDLLRSSYGRRGRIRPALVSLEELRDSLDGAEPAALSVNPGDTDPVRDGQLRHMMASLPLAHQTAIDLIYLHDQAGVDVSHTLGVSPSRVTQLLREGLDLLRADPRAVHLLTP